MQIEWQRSTFESIVYAGRKYIIKRDDLLLPIGGNKARKLYHLSQQNLSKVKNIVSFGGAQSNAMLALSQFCKFHNIQFEYYTRAVPKWLKQKPLGNLANALDNGMQWHINQFGLPPESLGESKLLIPQGISMPEAELGIKKLAVEIEQYCSKTGLEDIAIVLPSGTGATALYLQQRLSHTVYTIPCIGNAETLTSLFKQLLPAAEKYPTIIDNTETESFRFGEPHVELLNIYQELLKSTGIEFELLYDAKAWLTLINWQCDKPIIYIHNGGTSGNISMLARYKRLGMTQ
jgi:1-aminocyclopropane-1-carboxylate deaminase/D-cysteine desulfhydrase-like pyridoxal-dependent ACC family enzyme